MRCWLSITLVLLTASTAWADEIAALRARLRERRMEPMVVRVVTSDGKRAAGVRVELARKEPAIKLGCNIFLWGRCGDAEVEAAYRRQFAALFDYATLPFYWWSYEPEQGETQYDRTKRMARWCHQNEVECKGHPLLWNYDEPGWLPDDTGQVKALALARVGECVKNFARKEAGLSSYVAMWDVVNEAARFDRFADRAPKLTAAWQKAGQVDMVQQAFKIAREANPDAKLLINDYDITGRYEILIDRLRQEDGSLPFDIIGIQSHMHHGFWSSAKIRAVCERLSRYGLPVHFTELTMLSGELGWEREQPWPSTEDGEQRQAEELEKLLLELLAFPAVEIVTWWDFSDLHAWQGAPAGLLRKDMSPKPAYDVLKRMKLQDLRNWREGQTDAQGEFKCHALHGKYQVQAVTADKKVVSGDATVAPQKGGGPVEVIIILEKTAAELGGP